MFQLLPVDFCLLHSLLSVYCLNKNIATVGDSISNMGLFLKLNLVKSSQSNSSDPSIQQLSHTPSGLGPTLLRSQFSHLVPSTLSSAHYKNQELSIVQLGFNPILSNFCFIFTGTGELYFTFIFG